MKLLCVLDCITEIAFGQNIDTLRSDSSFGNAFDAAQVVATERFWTPPLVVKIKRVGAFAVQAVELIGPTPTAVAAALMDSSSSAWATRRQCALTSGRSVCLWTV